MLIIAQLLYVTITFLYLFIGDSSIMWGGVNHINHYFIIVSLCYICLNRKRLVGIERLLMKYIIFLNVSLIFYTLPCVWAYRDWIIYNTFIFSIVMGIFFVATIIYGFNKHRNELGEY